MGEEKSDLLVKDVKVYNSYLKKFYDADVSVKNGKIYYVDYEREGFVTSDNVVEGGGRYMIPGLIDIHMHIESSMMTPETFCDYVASCGVTTIVSEPHEIANVNGMQGVLDNICAGESCPIDVYYGIPSCVPSTDSSLETTGGAITCADMERLAENDRVICVGEVMNYRQVIRENDLQIGKFLDKLNQEGTDLVIEGHCPSLKDLDLAKFLYLGIDGDHTEHDEEGLMQRFRDGMYVELQEKMLHPWVIGMIRENHLEERFGFVTDDVMADTLVESGQLNAVIRKAIALGMEPEQAIYNGTFTNARRMRLYDRGALSPGKLADFVLLVDLESMTAQATYKRGVCIFDRSAGRTAAPGKRSRFPKEYFHSVKLGELPLSDFALDAGTLESGSNTVTVRAMEVCDGSTMTRERHVDLPVKDGRVEWENSACALAVVAERYGKDHTKGYGFVCGDVIKTGAVATTYAHDSHNLLVVGRTAKEMQMVANEVIRMQGGIVTADKGEITARLRLNVGGIVSDAPIDEIAGDLKKVRESLIRQGYRHYNPIMSLCTLSLPVSPALKLTNRGLVDVTKGKIVGVLLR